MKALQKLKCTVAYDGSRFYGYQVQPGRRTVQREIETALMKMHKGKKIRITASGRTDRGVHALGQVIHFESPLKIPEDNWTRALNSLCPEDIRIRRTEVVPHAFHARYDVKKKEYRYRLLTRQEPDLFRRLYTMHEARSLDLEAMNRAASWIVGTHDFSCFSASDTEVKDKVRTIYHLDIRPSGADEMVIRIIGSGFLYQMVRIITGTLLDIGIHKRPAEDIKVILDGKDRRLASSTAPACGLVLWSVTY